MNGYSERIIEIIHRNKVTNVPELSRILGISKPAIQYHIKRLLANGEIQSSTGKTHAIGRPINCYRLSDKIQPDNLAFLADILLSYISNMSENKLAKESYLSILANLITNNNFESMPVLKRIDHCIGRLSEMNYQPHWEVTHSGSFIHFRNCPYRVLISSHPELCVMDRFLLDYMIGEKVEVIHLQKDNDEPYNDCEFFFKR